MFNYGYGGIQTTILGVFPGFDGRLRCLSISDIYIYIYICRVGVKVRVRVKGVKRIPIDARHDRYAIEEIFTSANMTMMELDK